MATPIPGVDWSSYEEPVIPSYEEREFDGEVFDEIYRYYDERDVEVELKVNDFNVSARECTIYDVSVQYARKLVNGLKRFDDVERVFSLACDQRSMMGRYSRKRFDIHYTFYFLVSEVLPDVYAESINDKIDVTLFNCIKKKYQSLIKTSTGFKRVFYEKLFNCSLGYQNFDFGKFRIDIMEKDMSRNERLKELEAIVNKSDAEQQEMETLEKCATKRCLCLTHSMKKMWFTRNKECKNSEANTLAFRIIIHQYLIDPNPAPIFAAEPKPAAKPAPKPAPKPAAKPTSRKSKLTFVPIIETRSQKKRRLNLEQE